MAAARLRRRGDAWPPLRDAAFVAGCLLLGAAGPVQWPGGHFTAHVAEHLAAVMAAPLLMALARPLTLALRALPPGGRRALLVPARSRPVGFLTRPPVAAALEAGGLWAFYRTGLWAGAAGHPWLHALVHAHMVVTGVLFGVSLLALDPLRHRPGPVLRGGCLLAASAAHAVLARTLYAAGPPGTAFPAADLRAGAQLMYYGGDAVELAAAAVIAAQWYRAKGRRTARAHRRAAAAVPS
ncbi:cytochrome c oxidase assembly protein [Streptomyces sp. NPDC059506]|uniref:cytochrome c oxidase assembly protein n=1 Tax=Streptomyces sp. NPDC059506 TaxID=3347751 RepID=UPI0036C1E8B3